MNLRKNSIATFALAATLVGASLAAATPAMAASVTQWISKPTQSNCISSTEGAVRAASYSGYTNIRSSKCIYLSSRNVWEAWVSYTTP